MSSLVAINGVMSVIRVDTPDDTPVYEVNVSRRFLEGVLDAYKEHGIEDEEISVCVVGVT